MATMASSATTLDCRFIEEELYCLTAVEEEAWGEAEGGEEEVREEERGEEVLRLERERREAARRAEREAIMGEDMLKEVFGVVD